MPVHVYIVGFLKKHGKWSTIAIWYTWYFRRNCEYFCEFRFCKGVFDEASHGVHTHPYRLPEPNPGKHKWSGAKEGKRWGKAGNKPTKLSHIHFSSYQGAALTYSSSISFGVCISNSKLLPPGGKGEEDVTSFLQLAKDHLYTILS